MSPVIGNKIKKIRDNTLSPGGVFISIVILSQPHLWEDVFNIIAAILLLILSAANLYLGHLDS